ncbi:RNA polymerase sigma-70 factor, ECF subfamily [Nannocystis exedens]|uniref:RNA polymerase sigma factor n=1 Tax=Nannocystis exedens TaxID=54 RepID=A0A1I1UG51_9BACT|nr:RNA polymerase sigma-70 factor, ECF subfamily protein [Nannocystis exedens]SFD69811.1 RNA polymerase sigma-70 factor, ECF subfamily [Nannocystis exedens]
MSRVTDPERVYSAEELAAAAPPDEPEPAPAPDETLTPEQRAENARRAEQDRRDRQLVRRLKQGDEAAFRELVHTYQNRIFGLMLRMIGNRQEAEDLAQEVFIIVYRAIGNYRGEGRFYTWLYRVATNTCKNRIKYLKGRNFHRSLDIDETPQAQMPAAETGAVITFQSQVPGPEAVTEGMRMEKIVQRELAALDPDHRLLIVLRDVQGMSYQDIIKITGLQEGTLKSRLHRARLALKERLEPFMR